MDCGLKEILRESGAEEYGPILAMRGVSSKELVYMKDKDLIEVRTLIELLKSLENTNCTHLPNPKGFLSIQLTHPLLLAFKK